MAKLFIGMPAYNSDDFIAETIESLQKQTFKDWVLLISDNCSTDKTGEIARRYAQNDDRIKYIRQNSNIGAGKNFVYLLERAVGEYFMWAAADDIREPEFVESCISFLEKNPSYGAAFTGLVSVDTYGRTIREYPELLSLSGKKGHGSIYKYIMFPEILGKANFSLFSIFRLDVLKLVLKNNIINNDFGSDMCIAISVFSQSGMFIGNDVLFRKKRLRSTDVSDKVNKVVIKYPYNTPVPIKDLFSYLRLQLRAVRGTKYYYFVFMVLVLKFLLNIKIYIYLFFIRIKNYILKKIK